MKRSIGVVLLASVFASGCASTTGNGLTRETAGTVFGSIAGALIGSQIGGGTGRSVAVIAGAIAGGALGNWFGSKLDERDQEKLAVSTQSTLRSGSASTWSSDHSGASGKITPVSSRTVTQPGKVTRAEKISKAGNLQAINESWQAVRSANLRAAPSTAAQKVGGLSPAQTFTALGRTENDWIAVSRKGVLIGYVHAPLVRPYHAPSDSGATDLDTLTVAQAKDEGFDLDAFDPSSSVTDEIAVETTCRTLEYEVSTTEGSGKKTVDACQSTDGTWQIG